MRNFSNLEEAHAYFTECNLATLVDLLYRKSSSKASVSRQRSICLNMLIWVNPENMGEVSTWKTENGRVVEIVRAAQKAAEENQLTPVTSETVAYQMEGALDRWMETHKA